MHEFALAEAVLVAAEEAAEREGIAKISLLSVRIGELQQITRDTFEFCLSQIRADMSPRIGSTEIRLEIEPATFRCRACETRFSLSDAKALLEDEGEAVHFLPELAHAFLGCPACRSADFEVTAGRGISIASIEGETSD